MRFLTLPLLLKKTIHTRTHLAFLLAYKQTKKVLPLRQSVRVLSDAIKRQALRNARTGHDLVKERVEALETHETFHADHFSDKLEFLGEKLRKAEEKAQLAEEAIDKERLRHAQAKQKIEQEAKERISALQEQEDATIERQHRSEEKIKKAESKLEQEEAELKHARKHHLQVLELAQQKEQETERIIQQEKEREMEDEEAAEARKEAAEGKQNNLQTKP